MKTIKRKDIEKTIKKEFKVGRSWNRKDWGHCFALMIDTRDGSIWVDVFTSSNEWKEYHDDEVHHLDGNVQFPTVADCEQAYIDDAIRLLKEAGWTIEE